MWWRNGFSNGQNSITSHTLVGNNIFGHSDVFEASPVGAARNTSSFSTLHLASLDWHKHSEMAKAKYIPWC